MCKNLVLYNSNACYYFSLMNTDLDDTTCTWYMIVYLILVLSRTYELVDNFQ